MAYINVAEWSSDQVTEWLKGLDNTMYQYTHSFTNNGVSGKQLLNIRPYELEQLGIKLIGHQEIILEAVEYLKNFHYNLEKENLQYLALHVSTSSRSLYRQLNEQPDQYLPTQTLKDITRLITQIKALILWLDHASFTAQHYKELRSNLLKICLEIATSSQRDRFMEQPVVHIRQCALKLTEISDFTIIMEDPLVIQPSSLELVTLKKRENDVGFLLMNSNCGIQRITEIKYNSPAYLSGKIEDGDGIVQINYQTVVGWNDKRVFALLNDSPPDVLITLKTKPKHNKIYGQIYIKPYRLPSKKRSLGYRWGDLPSPRAGDFFPSNDVPLKKVVSDSESSSSEIMTPTDDKPLDKEMRLYMPKPRAVLQRRHSISGDQYNSFKSSSSNWFFNDAKSYSNNNDSPSLRDKSVSFGFGLELTPRPTTCLGLGGGNGATANSSSNGEGVLKGSLPEMMTSEKKMNGEKKPGISKVVRFESTVKLEEQHVDTKYTCNVDNTVLETFEPIPYVDEEEKGVELEPTPVPVSEPLQVEAPNVVVINREVVRRGKLDKSFSTPAYGSDNDSDTPPAIEPRKEHLQKIPPVPPPRPRKLPPPPLACPSSSMFVKPQPASSPHEFNDEKNKSKMANVIDLKAKKEPLPTPFTPETPSGRPAYSENVLAEPLASDLSDCGQLTPPCTSVTSPASTAKLSQVRKIPATKHFLDEPFELEMAAPLKNKTLTLKKKNSLLAKRRLVSLKALDTNDIQGHLYRRAKNRHGSTFWARYYFVLVEYVLYGFRTKESPKADFLIFLTGFTVSLAKEVHSKPFAFKVYHPSKSFYFAAETSAALAQWMEYIKQAALKGGVKTNVNTTNLKELFSETESSDDDLDLSGGGTMKKHWATPSPSSGGGGCGGSDADSVTSTPVTTTKADSGGGYHLNFGSLKKFAKSSLAFSHGGGHDNSGSSTSISSSPSESKFLGLFSSSKNQAERKVSSDIPQPTSAFRSYRRGGGAAIGGGGSGALVFSPNLFTNHQNLENYPPVERSNSIALSERSLVLPPPPSAATSVAAIVEKLESIQTPPVPAERTPKPIVFTPQDDEIADRKLKSNLQHIDEIRKSYKTSPHNYIHASNPNLVEFDFPTVKAIDFSTKIHSHNNWDVPFDTSKKFTLKDLMLQKQHEEAQDMYNKRVFRGVEKSDDTLKKKMNRPDPVDHHHQGETNNGDDTKISKIQKRSLPITPDYAQSFKPDDQDILYTRSREGQKLRDFGYEMISGDDNQQQQKTESTSTASSWSTKRNDRVVPGGGSTKKKSFNWMNSSSSHDDKSSAGSSASVRSGSFKKVKSKPMSKFDNLKASSEKIFQFKSGANTNDKDAYNKSRQMEKVGTSSLAQWSTSLKSGTASLDDAAAQPFQHGTYKSNSMRKNSAPERVSYFSKISFQSHKSVPKDKTLLGSPRLHRAIFGRTASHDHQHNNSNSSFGTDHEIFSSIVFPSKNKSEQFNQTQSPSLYHQQQQAPVMASNKMNNSVDYGALQLPPVFEPETYSLSDPSTSMTLLKRRHNNQANKQ